ncbi:uncharacterized protein LOC18424173 [Amborella trichopoda]|uniref:DNL-type domain-containing protein n=1 Tax=Amborella trichopoda TaxID=13333 RepID=W1NLW2_AMBTC|nr:uncharacterized protein LOC18424173 [Amborella trichopoda]ERM96244.1 hypothetical protein AMTR_s00001p00142230 [Amborella trichopoda]|eukprot:XP_006828828.1 uncharacterized protein LOC18424173 [Amborella trichopoda]
MGTLSTSVNLRGSASSLFSLLPEKSRLAHRVSLPSAFNKKSPDNCNHGEPENTSIVPQVSFAPFSKDAAMGLVLSAATGRGWTTGSGMEGPPVSEADVSNAQQPVSTFPWSLFTRSPRRRMRVAFTCNVCGQRTTRAINPHAYTDGTVFVQCAGCNIFHKLVDNLNLFHEMTGYVHPKFIRREPKRDGPFDYLDIDDFPLF